MILDTLGIPILAFPFTYLGAPIAKGQKKKHLFLPLIDKIRAKFLGWNLELMSQGGRLALIKSVLFALPVYLLQAINPPKSVIYEIEQIFAKFFWGNVSGIRKLHWTKWKNMCFPLEEKGLNVCSLTNLTAAFSIKLWYKFRENRSLWANFMNGKYGNLIFPGDRTPKPADSRIWRRLFSVSKLAQENIFWNIGKGQAFVWHDHWYHYSSVEELQASNTSGLTDYSLLENFLNDEGWNLEKLNVFPLHVKANIILNLPGKLSTQAFPLWKPSMDGHFNTSSARDLLRDVKPKSHMFASIWSPYLTPTISVFWWKTLHGWLPVDNRIQSKGLILASKCQCCRNQETIAHVLLHNKEVNKAWKWFSNMLLVPCLPQHTLATRLQAWISSSDFAKKGHIRIIIPLLIASITYNHCGYRAKYYPKTDE